MKVLLYITAACLCVLQTFSSDLSDVGVVAYKKSGSKGSGGSSKGGSSSKATSAPGSSKGTYASKSGSSKGTYASKSGSSKGTYAPKSYMPKSSKGTYAPKGSKAPKGTKAPKATTPPETPPPETPPPETEPPVPATDGPTSSFAPTSAPTYPPCIGDTFKSTFSAPVQNVGDKPLKGKFKGTYLSSNTVDLFFSINFGDYVHPGVTLSVGDLVDWSINTDWGNTDSSGAAVSKCRPARVGPHYDPSFACSVDSEHIQIDGQPEPVCIDENNIVSFANDYKCNPTMKIPKKIDRCEVGDLSGKLGQLVVKETAKGFLKLKYKGVDPFFVDQETAFDLSNTLSIVLSLGGTNFMCAEFIPICE